MASNTGVSGENAGGTIPTRTVDITPVDRRNANLALARDAKRQKKLAASTPAPPPPKPAEQPVPAPEQSILEEDEHVGASAPDDSDDSVNDYDDPVDRKVSHKRRRTTVKLPPKKRSTRGRRDSSVSSDGEEDSSPYSIFTPIANLLRVGLGTLVASAFFAGIQTVAGEGQKFMSLANQAQTAPFNVDNYKKWNK